LNKGQSLVELLVAIGVFVVGVATIGLLVLTTFNSSRQAVERTQAVMLAREGIEAARSIRDDDFNNLTTGSHGIVISDNKWIFSGSSDAQDQFVRVVTITDISTSTKKIESSTTWQFSQSRQGAVDLVTYLTNWNQ